jgi:integrase
MAGVKERNGRFTGYCKLNGKQKGAGTYDTYDAAIEAARRAEANRPSKTEQPAKVGGRYTVAGYMPVFLEGHKLRNTTRESYGSMEKHIARHIGGICLHELMPAQVRIFARTLEASKLSPAYVNKIVTLLNTMCKTAVADGYMPSNPCETVRAGDKSTREMRILTKAEFARIRKMVHPHYKPLIETLVTTGMRWGECIAVKTDAIVQVGKTWVIRVRRTFAEIAEDCPFVGGRPRLHLVPPQATFARSMMRRSRSS